MHVTLDNDSVVDTANIRSSATAEITRDADEAAHSLSHRI